MFSNESRVIELSLRTEDSEFVTVHYDPLYIVYVCTVFMISEQRNVCMYLCMHQLMYDKKLLATTAHTHTIHLLGSVLVSVTAAAAAFPRRHIQLYIAIYSCIYSYIYSYIYSI